MLLGAPTSDPPRPTEASSARLAAVAASPQVAKSAPAPQRPKPDLPDPTADTARSRLAYDKELNRTFIEVVDLKSGEVVDRFPPEEIVRHAEAMLEQAEASRAAKRAGLVLDRLV